MSIFVCPKCKTPLYDEGNSLFCQNRHCFDKSKYKYVNLLLQNGKQNHGDNKLMIRSRKSFLDRGYYSHLRLSLCESICKNLANGVILDAGCGEGYYLDGLLGTNFELFGIDISKDALIYASKRQTKIQTAVASVYSMPVADGSCDGVLSVFSPFAREEFLRVLKDNGYLFSVIPGALHLIDLKRAIYETPYENEVADFAVEGFELVENVAVEKVIHLECNEDIMNLMSMTPYFYRTSARDIEKLKELPSLETLTQFNILVYKKK